MNNFCGICPRNCGIDRSKTVGFCGVGDRLKVALATIYNGEEPCLTGNKGSGTIFFSGCNLACVYCQNAKISHDGYGKEITVDRLVEVFFELKEKGATNINLVTPSHYVNLIKNAIITAKSKGFDLPFLYNSGGYDSIFELKLLDGLIDIYMPDFKYFDDALAKKYSKCNNYVDTVKLAIKEMYRQVGKNQFDEDGILKRGIIVRHLVLPGYVDNSKNIISYLYDEYGDNIYISIMNQYFPSGNLAAYEEINRVVSCKEYDDVLDYAVKYGVNNAYIQSDGANTDDMIPAFDLRGV